jgi:inosine-uridine nucleoside N-ribohydrolase
MFPVRTSSPHPASQKRGACSAGFGARSDGLKPTSFLARGLKPPLLGCCLLLSFLVGHSGAETVWIDTDISIGSPFREVDDAFALLLAFRSPELKIAGISTSYGNAPLAATTASARNLLSKVEPHRAVYPGAESRHDIERETEASRALALALRKKGSLTYIALGPLTNLAAFQSRHPELVPRIKRVIFIGGITPQTTLRFGSRHPIQIHDANVVKDPEAVRQVLGRFVPITLIPIDTAANLSLNATDLEAMRRDPAGDFVQRKSRFWLWFWTNFVGTKGAPIFDAAAILAASAPSQIVFAKRSAEVDQRGALVIQTKRAAGARRVNYAVGLRDTATQSVVGALRAPPRQ